MEVLKINLSKLKITLTAEECDRYGIRERGGDFDTRLVRDVVSDILDEAGVGDFCKPKEKLLVQLYPIKGGGAELFITKLSAARERDQKAIQSAENLSTYTRERAVFLFDDFRDLYRVAGIGRLASKRSDLYRRSDGKYLLTLDEERLGAMSDCDVISEFAARLPATSAPEEEWDELLIRGDALQRLAERKIKSPPRANKEIG